MLTPLLAVFFSLMVFAGVLTAQLLLVKAWSRTAALAAQPTVFASTAPAPVLVRLLGRLATPAGTSEASQAERDLVQAGIRRPHALAEYLAARTVLALGLPLLGALGVRTLTTTAALGALLGLATVGYMLPVLGVKILGEARRGRIRRVFPNALDMLVNCLESGLGIDAALRYVARELAGVGPELATDLDILNAELQSGLPRQHAMAGLKGRVGLPEIDGLVSVVAQAERYGVGIAESMRAHAKMSRRRRILDAERRAAEAAPKLTVVMVLFVLPPLFIVLIGPTAIRLTTSVIPMLEQQ